jgi:aminopeptidase N
VREETDVAPYLAAWKASALAHERLMATEVTANQQQYDVTWYDLNLTFTPATSNVAGTVRMKAKVVSGPISTVDLDFYSNMVLDGATSAGLAATSSRVANVLTLNLDHAYATGQTVDVTVTYHGNPTAAGYLFFQTVNGRQLIWSLDEAYGARSWWPCKDAPEDKADSVDVHFTCPVAMTTVSNGTLLSRVVNGTVATTNWHERYPIASYLVSIAAYPYTITEDWYRPTPTDSMLIRFHTYPETAPSVAAVQAKVKNMIAAFASRFGEYPFILEKYGHAQFQFGGGQEHQTCTSLGSFLEYVVAHELTHQWWGDLVTCRDFHHIWLNEGFATYGEALWAEATGGSAAYHADIEQYRYLGPGSVWVPDATDQNRIFDSHLSYAKGGLVLHMLRHVLGDAVFFNALQTYHTTWGYKSAVTEDFRDVCESVSGRNLHPFFQQWIYGEYYPIYNWVWSAAPAGADTTSRSRSCRRKRGNSSTCRWTSP